jgi:hypothetical protein
MTSPEQLPPSKSDDDEIELEPLDGFSSYFISDPTSYSSRSFRPLQVTTKSMALYSQWAIEVHNDQIVILGPRLKAGLI